MSIRKILVLTNVGKLLKVALMMDVFNVIVLFSSCLYKISLFLFFVFLSLLSIVLKYISFVIYALKKKYESMNHEFLKILICKTSSEFYLSFNGI